MNMWTPEPVNSYVKHNTLYIRPTFTVDHFGEDFLNNGDLDVNATWGTCNSIDNKGCHVSGHLGGRESAADGLCRKLPVRNMRRVGR